MPVSTSVQPSPSASAHRLMWFSPAIGRRIRSQYTPGATAKASPGPGTASNGYVNAVAGSLIYPNVSRWSPKSPHHCNARAGWIHIAGADAYTEHPIKCGAAARYFLKRCACPHPRQRSALRPFCRPCQEWPPGVRDR